MQTTSLQRNSVWLLLARFSVQGLAVIFVALTARRLEVSTFGQFSVIASLVLIGNTLTTFGTDTLLIREIARAGQVTRLVLQILGLQLSLSLLWWLGILILFRNPPLWLYTLSLFPLAFFSVISAVLRALQRMDLFWTLNVGNGVMQILAGFLCTDLWTLCIYLFIGHVLISVLAVILCRALLVPLDGNTPWDFRPLWKLAWPFATLAALTIVAQRMGILFVSALIGDAETGLYSAAARLVDGMKFGHYAVLGALLPMLSGAYSDSHRDFRHGFTAILSLSLVMAGIVTLFSKPITLLIYGTGFEDAASLLIVTCWSIIPYTVSAFISVDLVSRRLESKLLKTSLYSIAAFAVLFPSLISLFELQGAAYAALIGETLQALIFFQAWSGFKAGRKEPDVFPQRQ